jgi:hypothetical protein
MFFPKDKTTLNIEHTPAMGETFYAITYGTTPLSDYIDKVAADISASGVQMSAKKPKTTKSPLASKTLLFNVFSIAATVAASITEVVPPEYAAGALIVSNVINIGLRLITETGISMKSEK